MRKCPKCGSNNIIDGKLLPTVVGGLERPYLTFFPSGKNFLRKGVYVISYACGDCGYLETYVSTSELKEK